MASRISDVIETHARHAARRVKHVSKRMTEHAKTNATLRRVIWIIASVVCILIAIYIAESIRLKQMDAQTDATTPYDCDTMMFSKNIQRCETTIRGRYSTTPPIERAIACEPSGERKEYLRPLCDEYDEALIKTLRSDDLAEYGIAPWERDPIINNGTLRVRAGSTPTRISVVCDGKIIANDDAPTSDDDGLYRVQLQEIDAGDCKIIASITEGSATSENFVMTAR